MRTLLNVTNLFNGFIFDFPGVLHQKSIINPVNNQQSTIINHQSNGQSTIIHHQSKHISSIQKRFDLGVDLLIGKRIDGERMLIAGGCTHPAPFARHIDDMDLSPFLGMLDFKGAVWTKGYAEPASPARIFVGQY